MVRRLITALAVGAVMVGVLAAGSPATLSNLQGVSIEQSSAQTGLIGELDYCGPWQRSWFVSSGGWWYF
jgi:hypothetical protein